MTLKNILIILLLFGNSMLGQEIASIKNIKINSKSLDQKREILVYTPKNYDEDKLVFYDVIYVFDAQNREFFDFTHSVISFISNAEKKYIVVGITSPYFEETDYARNNDMLPLPLNVNPIDFYNGYNGNADNFLKCVKKEVVSYMEKHYRTKYNRLAVGHSLSASFILYSLFKEPGLFDAFFAISPNLAYDKERLVKEFESFDYQRINGQIFLYLSNANEGVDYWKSWKPAREKVYAFLENSGVSDKVYFVRKEFPDETHWSTFAPALTYGLKEYFKYEENKKVTFSEETYEVTITVRVPDKNDVVYITGNQPALGDWNPGLIKMSRESEFEREIRVKVRIPAEIKFTRGSWETEGVVKFTDGNNILIDPEKTTKFEFEITEWFDKID